MQTSTCQLGCCAFAVTEPSYYEPGLWFTFATTNGVSRSDAYDNSMYWHWGIFNIRTDEWQENLGNEVWDIANWRFTDDYPAIIIGEEDLCWLCEVDEGDWGQKDDDGLQGTGLCKKCVKVLKNGGTG